MPLSEQERRALEELEAQLSADDPRFASAMIADPYRAQRRRRMLMAALAVVAGVALVVFAISVDQIWITAPAFVLMVLGVAHALSPSSAHLQVVDEATGRVRAPRASTHSASGQAKARRRRERGSASSAPRGDFMNRLEERWERRRRENQGW